jgi:hypothetical protein
MSKNVKIRGYFSKPKEIREQISRGNNGIKNLSAYEDSSGVNMHVSYNSDNGQKINFTLEQALKPQRGSRGVALFFI